MGERINKNNEIDFEIREKFKQTSSIEDLINLINYVGEREIKNFRTLSLRKFRAYVYSKKFELRYKTFEINKKNGTTRTIHAPRGYLKIILKSINRILSTIYTPPKYVTGFVKGKSIVNNAFIHTGNYYVFNLDLKDFFYSFNLQRIKYALMSKPFQLPEKVAYELAKICTCPIKINGETKFVLPQGSPTSPILTNILCKRLDKKLNSLARKYGLKYSRYADDITFSSLHNVYNNAKDLVKNDSIDSPNFITELKNVLDKEGLRVNEAKIRLQKYGYRQEVTGLVVNEKVNIKRRYYKNIRMWLYYWERYGYKRANEIFVKYYMKDRGYLQKKPPELKKHIQGKLDFLKMVRGKLDARYQKLEEWFNKLNKIGYPVLHNAYEVVEILQKFGSNKHNLKYVTHEWGSNKFQDYDSFINIIKEEWKKINSRLMTLNKRLYAKISNFIFNENLGQEDLRKKDVKNKVHTWGEYRLTFGWSNIELREFMKKYPDKSPFDFRIPEEIRKRDITKLGNKKKTSLEFFRDYVDLFKNEIEFRTESENLEEMFRELYEKILRESGFNISGLDKLSTVSFYTDVYWIKRTIKQIFQTFTRYPEKKNIIIDVEQETKTNSEFKAISIRITQEDSFSDKSVYHDKFIKPGGDIGEIIKILRNLCDYSIITKFTDGAYKLNYLVSQKGLKFRAKPKIPVIGFTHELKFYL